MNKNSVIGDIVDLKLSQMGATQITKLRSQDDPELIFPLQGWEQPKELRAPDGALARRAAALLRGSLQFSTIEEILQTIRRKRVAAAVATPGAGGCLFPAQ